MRGSKRKWLIWGGVTIGVVLAALAGAGWHFSKKLEPFVREQTVRYLSLRFNGRVEIARFNVTMPIRDPLKVLLNKGRGARLKANASGILLRQHGAREGYPLLKIRRMTFDLDASKLFDTPAIIDQVRVEGMELVVPPKGERQLRAPSAEEWEQAAEESEKRVEVVIGRIVADGTKLIILPKSPDKAPLEFDLYSLSLHGAGAGLAMKYTTTMKNSKPPGVIYAHGTFGPFVTEEPGETPLTGDYVFKQADLAVFKSIAGILDSTGRFGGNLNEIVVDGETTVPNFRLVAAGNPMMLKTRYHAIVDGTNGNTRLEPVNAVLGSAPIRCRGRVVRFPGENGKTVDLSCAVKDARLDDLLRLAVKGSRSPMLGRVDVNVKIDVPPGKQPYAERLQLSGPFKLRQGLFTNVKVQEQLDDMSRRAQGKPRDQSIEGMTSNFDGRMTLKRGLLSISDLVFTVEGAMVRLEGKYDIKADTVDFHGQLRTDARLSQMMKSRWKRLVLKPVDPFFAKNGAGAQFDIAITGPASSPQFGLDKKDKKKRGTVTP